ncbi:MAG: nucleotidyltransferase family protein [Erythrobacter sp.]
MTQVIDRFLAMSLRSVARGEGLPPWPQDWPDDETFQAAVFARIAFHGVALVLLRGASSQADWPSAISARMRKEAHGQRFWEISHRGLAQRLIAALAAAGAPAILTKGTALAYAIYSDPAERRRGDTDLLLGLAPRKVVRRALRAAGFDQIGDRRPLQETWGATCPAGFFHAFDLHWRASASAVVSQCLERGGVGTRSIALPRLSEQARALCAADNLILIAINRALHLQFGYRSGDDKPFDQDRLIWAMDVSLLCAAFGPDDWDALVAVAAATGTSPLVLSTLQFAEATLAAAVPANVKDALSGQGGDATLLRCLSTRSSGERLRLELAASPGMTAKLRLISYALLPGTEVLHERYPEAAHWPLAALQARRLWDGIGRLAGRGA